MSPDEFDLIKAALKTAYPNIEVMPDTYSINYWYMCLKDLDYETCSKAVAQLSCMQEFPPSIALIRKQCSTFKNEKLKTKAEAWEDVQQAIRYFGYVKYSEAMETLSEDTREAVRQIGWRSLCFSENQEVLRAHFFRTFDNISRKKKELLLLPKNFQPEKIDTSIKKSIIQKDKSTHQDDKSTGNKDKSTVDSEFLKNLRKKYGLRQRR